jgi:hypothetical protein
MKKKPNQSQFSLSKSASKFREEFVRNSPEPSKILKKSCDQLKLEVLNAHPELGMWIKQRTKKWIDCYY